MSDHITFDMMWRVLEAHKEKLITEGSADDLALHFKSLELVAQCGSPRHCAVAESFKVAVGEAFPAEVSQEMINIVGVSAFGATFHVKQGRDSFCVGTSFEGEEAAQLRKFIVNFDSRLYPDISVGRQ